MRALGSLAEGLIRFWMSSHGCKKRCEGDSEGSFFLGFWGFGLYEGFNGNLW